MEAEGKLPLLKACETDLTTVPVVRPEGPDYTCYKRRWYILFVFLLTSMMSNALWNTWPPIQATCQLVFGWTNQNTLIIGAISSIASLVFIVPSSWVLNNMGLRFAVIFSVGIQALACIILIFPLENRYSLPMVYLSTGLIGTFTSICQSTAILVLVAAWFPPSERTTVTVWTFLLSDLGIAISYVTGPYIVPDVGKYKTGQKMDINVLRKNTSAERMDFLKGRITDYMILESVIMTALLVCIFVYFPDRPPKPPCASSATRRLDFGQGIKTLFTNTQFLLLLATYCTSNGVQWGWLIVMDVVLAGVGINEKVVGWIGFGMRFCVAPALFASSFSDRFRKYIKHTLAILFVGAACIQSVYSLACNQPWCKGQARFVSVLAHALREINSRSRGRLVVSLKCWSCNVTDVKGKCMTENDTETCPDGDYNCFHLDINSMKNNAPKLYFLYGCKMANECNKQTFCNPVNQTIYTKYGAVLSSCDDLKAKCCKDSDFCNGPTTEQSTTEAPTTGASSVFHLYGTIALTLAALFLAVV